MSSYPSSVCATHGSNKRSAVPPSSRGRRRTFVDFRSFPRHIDSTTAIDSSPSSKPTSNLICTTSSSGIAISAAEEAARLALYLDSTVEANPTYQHDSSPASVAARFAQMSVYLQGFDDVMEDQK